MGFSVVGAGVGVRDGLPVVGSWVGLVLMGAAAVFISWVWMVRKERQKNLMVSKNAKET